MKEQEGVYDLDGGVEKALGHRCLLVPGCQPLYPLNRRELRRLIKVNVTAGWNVL